MAKKKPPGYKKIAPKPTQFGVYFDESARILEKTNKSQYVFTAALLRKSRKAALEEKYIALRKEMTESCLKVVPHLEGHKAIRDGLLEIHAVDLYQSKGIYREANKASPGFWRKQHEWIELALRYASESDAVYFGNPIDSETYLEKIKGPARFLTSDTTVVRYEDVREKIRSLLKNPYFLTLPLILSEIDLHLAARNGRAEVYCHTNDEAVGFSDIQNYEYIQERGHLATLQQPAFKTCSEEQAIQAADVAGYVLLQHSYAQTFRTPLKPEFNRWFLEYVAPQLVIENHASDPERGQMLSAMFLEIILLSSGGPQFYRQDLRERLPRAIQKYFDDRRNPPQNGQDQMNKPPSGDGDLYD